MAGVYTVEVTVDGCSATSGAITVTAPVQPVANDDTYSSTTATPVQGNVTDNDVAPNTVIATVVSGPSSGTLDFNANGTFTYTPTNPPTSPVTFTYEICLVDCPDACDEATVSITFTIDCIVPNVITPNGDGVNDIVIINCIPERNPDVPNPSRLKVFNRWGDEIASFEPYYNEEGWDGTYGSGKKPVPAATYYYLFEADKNSGNKPQSGYIKVVR